MRDYDKDFRALNCWECFDSFGKMCHSTSSFKHTSITGSSNMGHGICCKPGSTSENCVNN